MSNEAYFIPHCDDGSCDLGRVDYTCPVCKKPTTDLATWWDQFAIMGGAKREFSCDKCEALLFVWYDTKYYIFIVEPLNEC